MGKYNMEELEIKLLNHYPHLTKEQAKMIIKQLFVYWENIIDNLKEN